MAKKMARLALGAEVVTGVEFGACAPKQLPTEMLVEAAATAVAHNPANAPPHEQIVRAVVTGLIAFTDSTGDASPKGAVPTPEHIALLTSRYWGKEGVKLPVAFLEPTPVDLRDRIIAHMNAWREKGCNTEFVWTTSPASARVRITRGSDGYWSYVGTDILHIPLNQPTMSLQAFTMSTPESEYKRVVRHETGHTLGFIHEQQLPEIVERLDPAKTIAWGWSALGWDETMVRSQILTPVDPRTVTMTPHADVRGIMCYMLPASITKDGQAIPGGTDIDAVDAAMAASLYPMPPSPPPPPPAGKGTVTLSDNLKAGTYTVFGP